LKLHTFAEYIAYLKGDNSFEWQLFINAITTNLTSFLRESHHFDYLRQQLIPQLLQRNEQSRRIRIWSAGCSSGEEPYSIASCLADVVPSDWDVRILATDLDTNMVQRATQGVYRKTRLEGIDPAWVKRCFHTSWATRDALEVNQSLKDMVVFLPLNLLHDWPMNGVFDVIFCRNVIIYFDAPTKNKLVDRFSHQLAPQGHLFVGHSETLFDVKSVFELKGNTIYAKY